MERPDAEVPTSALRAAVLDGLLTETQVIPIDRGTAEALADRIMEAVERRELTVLDRARVADWLDAVQSNVKPLLALRGKGQGVCDERGHCVMVLVETRDWPCDVVVCEHCENATQVERDD